MIKNFIVLSLLSVSCAYAGTVPLNITLPTKNEDTSNIPATGVGSLVSLKAEWGTCSGALFGTKIGEVVITTLTSPVTNYSVTNIPAGSYCFRAYATKSTSTGTLQSNPTNALPVTVPDSPPNPPVLTVSEPTAYTLVKINDGIMMTRVGDVPLGTQCIKEQTANGYYVVPRNSVTFAGTIRPVVVFAKCS